MWEKRRMLLMKGYSATLINNLWGLHHRAHLPHRFTWGSEAMAPQSCLFCNHFWYLIQPTDSASLNHRSFFFPLVPISPCLSATNIRGDVLGFSVDMCTYTGLKLAQMYKSWKDGEIISAPRVPRQTAHGWVGGVGSVLSADNRAGLDYLQCTAHW